MPAFPDGHSLVIQAGFSLLNPSVLFSLLEEKKKREFPPAARFGDISMCFIKKKREREDELP